MTKLNIVPTIMDEFHVTGMLKVWYLAKIGAVSTVYINASSGRRLRTAQCQSVPNVFFAGTGKNSVPCLHTLVMVAPDHRDGHPKLLWLVTNIPNAEVADGEVCFPLPLPGCCATHCPRGPSCLLLLSLYCLRLRLHLRLRLCGMYTSSLSFEERKLTLHVCVAGPCRVHSSGQQL